MPLCSFCKSAEETIIQLFSECLCAQYIWDQTQIFFLGYINIPDVTLQRAILGFTDTSTKHFLLINQLLLTFLAFKNNIIKIKTPEERTKEENKFLKK